MLRPLAVPFIPLLLLAPLAPDAVADCPYRTQAPSGAIVSGSAAEHSIACIPLAEAECPECRSGFQHLCIGGRWVTLRSPCTDRVTLGVPHRPNGTGGAAAPHEQAQSLKQHERAHCVYYDRDRRRIDLPIEDLAWAEENGLVWEKIC